MMIIEQSDIEVVKSFLEKSVNVAQSEDSGEDKIKQASLYILYTHEDGSQSKDVVGNIEIS